MNRLQHRLDTTLPASAIGQALLERYLDRIEIERASQPRRERRLVRELCSLVEEVAFPTLTIRALLEAGSANPLRGRVCWRLIRVLQADGDLPDSAALRRHVQISRTIAQAPAPARAALERWVELRQENVGPHELSEEIRRYAELERILAEHPDVSAQRAIDLWLRRIVRRIVDCRCPPITRALDPDRCNSCEATTLTHGTRPSPAMEKQQTYAAGARRYLAQRRSTP